MAIHYALLMELTSEEQCRCATSDGVRCCADATGDDHLCNFCRAQHPVNGPTRPTETEQQLANRTGFGFWNTWNYDQIE